MPAVAVLRHRDACDGHPCDGHGIAEMATTAPPPSSSAAGTSTSEGPDVSSGAAASLYSRLGVSIKAGCAPPTCNHAALHGVRPVLIDESWVKSLCTISERMLLKVHEEGNRHGQRVNGFRFANIKRWPKTER